MKCKDIANEYQVTAMQVGRVRRKLNPDHDGGDLSSDEVEALRCYFDELEGVLERKEMEKSVEPQYVEGYVSYVQHGRREVECKIRDGGQIKTVYALVPTSVDPVRILNTSIKLEWIEYNDKKFYRHASLANVAWPKGYGAH